MTVKELITELSKYDENLEVCMDMDVEVEDGYYSGEYYATLNDVQYFPDKPFLKNFLILFGYNYKMNELYHEYISTIYKTSD